MEVSRTHPDPGLGHGPQLPVDPGRRHRRPSGERPPLPRNLGRSGLFWLAMVGYFVVTFAGILLFNPFAAFFGAVDSVVMRRSVGIRTDWLVDGALVVNLLASRWTIRILRWTVILALLAFRRWRHLFVFLGSLLVLELIAYQASIYMARPRPLGVTILGPWGGFSMPSRPLAGLAVTLLGVLYALLPHGRVRDAGKWVTGGVLGVLILARLLLGIETPSDALFGAVLGVAVGLCAFRFFTPNDVFPVSYRRGKSAHLDVGGVRHDAIVKAISDQIGADVVAIRPIGLEGSGGSTPLRLTIDRGDGSTRYLFAKLYALNHVRSDRWYKIGRSIIYGALEDETPFGTVRRFVEYEDYSLRLLHDHGFPSPEPYGIVEISPEREYMVLMEFFDGAVELGDAEVDDAIIDQGLDLVRRLWDLGVAHRDIKPANLMVQDGHLRVIDVFFMQVRPSPWRQAVDLGNMMLVLALRSDPETVYRRALATFTPDELSEAFAATRGVASPSQLRMMLKQDGRDLLARFRELAPARRPIPIQRWSLRRVVRTLWALVLGLIAFALVVSNWAVFA
ncbi:MAG: phosphatase PAP2 family protein [Actinomycetota bacterium]